MEWPGVEHGRERCEAGRMGIPLSSFFLFFFLLNVMGI
jgi:hypothetical protein